MKGFVFEPWTFEQIMAEANASPAAAERQRIQALRYYRSARRCGRAAEKRGDNSCAAWADEHARAASELWTDAKRRLAGIGGAR